MPVANRWPSAYSVDDAVLTSMQGDCVPGRVDLACSAWPLPTGSPGPGDVCFELHAWAPSGAWE
jgi:hypothetical protein